MANIQPPPLLSPTEVYTPPDVTAEPPVPAPPPPIPEVSPWEAYTNTMQMQYSPGNYTAEQFQTMQPQFAEGRSVARQMRGVGITADIDAAREEKAAREQLEQDQQKSEEYSYPTSPFAPEHPETNSRYAGYTAYEPAPVSNPPQRGKMPPNPDFAAMRGGEVPDVAMTKSVREGTANLIDQDYQVSQKLLDFVKHLPIFMAAPHGGERGQLGGGTGKPLDASFVVLSPVFEGRLQPNLAQARTSFHEVLHAWDAKQGWISMSPQFHAAAVMSGLNPVTFEDMVPGREYFAGLVSGDWAHVYNLPANYPGDWMQAVPLPLRKYYEDIYDPNKKTDIPGPLADKQKMEMLKGQRQYATLKQAAARVK